MKLMIVLAWVLALLSVAAAQSSTPLQFALMMTGSCNYTSGACTTKGSSQVIATSISPTTDAVSFSVKTTIGTYATLNFMVPGGPDFYNASSYATMSFGAHLARNHTLDLVTAPGGIILPGEDDSVLVASGAYVVLGGMGAFQDAYGSISFTTSFNTETGVVSAFVYGRPFILSPSRRAAIKSAGKKHL